MMERLNTLLAKIDALTLRERIFIAAAVLAVAVGLWEALLGAPLAAREQRASLMVDNLTKRIEQMNESMAATAQGINEGMPGNLERLKVLRDRLAETEESVRIFTTDLVDPAQMRFVLEDLIRQQSGLKLISMSNLDVQPLVEEDEAEADASTRPNLYRHGLMLIMEGPFLACLDYLRAVESLPWQLYWGRLELEARDYPLNRILIELHTLSLDEEWIGV